MKAIIFDFFGVVGQSTYQLVVEDLLVPDGQRGRLSDLHKAYDNGFVDDHEFLHSYATILNMPYNVFIDKYYKSEQRFSNSYAVLAYVEELRKSYKIGLLSNIGSDGYRRFIEPTIHHFDEVITSYDSQLAKPDVAIFELMASKLGVNVSECVMIDDSETNCQGARAAGMEAVRYDNLAQTKKDILRLTD